MSGGETETEIIIKQKVMWKTEKQMKSKRPECLVEERKKEQEEWGRKKEMI